MIDVGFPFIRNLEKREFFFDSLLVRHCDLCDDRMY